MNRLHTLIPMLGLTAAASLALVGCGEDNNTTCGTGTVLQDGMCVPSSTTTCGAGTVLTAGQCVPDGSVICEQGTVFDTASGQCVLDPSACADGTVLVGGECVPEDDTLTADQDEAAEPNDATGAGEITIPAIGADTTIHGCITPRGGAADQDVWIMNAAGPTLLEITADGVGGLAAGFIVQDNGIAVLPNYIRFGINLAGDTSKRQVFLPVAGTYLLIMDDSRALLTGDAAGNADTCYYGTIKQVAMPTATPLTVPQTTGQDSGNIGFYTYTPGGAGDIFDVSENTASASVRTAFIVRKNGTFYASTTYDTANDVPPFYTVGGLAATDTIEIIVDNVYNFALTSQAYTIDSLDIGGLALPTTGTVLTVPENNGLTPAAAYADLNYLYFDIATAGIYQFNLVSSKAIDMVIVRQDVFTPAGAFDTFASIDAFGTTTTRTTFDNEFVKFLTPGRYYFVTQNPAATTAGGSYTITSTVAAVTPTAVTYGTPLTAQALPASGSAFHTLDLTNPTWVEFATTATNWGTADVRVQAFDPAGQGWLGGNYVPVFQGTQIAAGTAPFGRILVGETRDFILRVNATAAVGTGPTYDLAVRERPHTAITMVAGTPVTRTGDPLVGPSNAVAAQTVTRYLVTGPAFGGLTALVTPAAAADPIIRRRGADEASLSSVDVGGDGEAETLSVPFGNTPAWIAFTVGDWNTGTTAFDLTLNATAPPYTPTSGTLAFSDACAGGTVIPLTGGTTPSDEGQSAALDLPTGWTLPFFGATAGQFLVNSNGFLAFLGTPPACAGVNCSFSNTALPTAAAPNGLVAPYWDDLANIQICRKDNAANNTVTLQWTGVLYNTTTVVQTQVVLHQNGVIDLIYGPQHRGTGSSATVGVENLTGTVGLQLSFNQAVVMPSTSRTLTPN